MKITIDTENKNDVRVALGLLGELIGYTETIKVPTEKKKAAPKKAAPAAKTTVHEDPPTVTPPAPAPAAEAPTTGTMPFPEFQQAVGQCMQAKGTEPIQAALQLLEVAKLSEIPEDGRLSFLKTIGAEV